MGANAQTSVPLFVANSVLTAAQQNISAATGVPVFATTVTRDAAFGGSNKVLAEGQLCYLEDSNIVQYYDGAAWATVGPATASALVRVGGGTLSGTSTAFTNVFSATYNAYKLDFTDCALTGTNADVYMILGATVTGYYGAAPGAVYATNAYASNIGSQNNAAAWAVSFASANNVGFTTELWNPFLTKRTFYRTGPFQISNTVTGTGQGSLDNSTSYTGFTVSTSTGNLTGTCNIYGYSLS